MDIPNFRYLEDAVKLIQQIDGDLTELDQAFKAKKKMLAHLLVAEHEEFSINYKPRKSDKKLVPQATKVTVPGGLKKLQEQYALLEELNDQYQSLDAIGAQIEIQFRANRDLNKAKNELKRVKTKIQNQMREVFSFLNEVAKAKVPESFGRYIEAIAHELNNHVQFADCSQFLYLTTSPDNSLVFTNYTMLEDAANDEGELATLYVAVQWDMGNDRRRSTINVFLDHDFELPNKLLQSGAGIQVDNVQQAVKSISRLLETENFSSSLGIVPLSLKLKMDPNALKSELFSYKEYVSKIEVDDKDGSITFTTRKGSGITDDLAQKVARQLFVEVRGIVRRSPQTKLRVKITKERGQFKIKFTMHGIAPGTELDVHDVEFLRDRFGLNEQQLRRIARIISKD